MGLQSITGAKGLDRAKGMKGSPRPGRAYRAYRELQGLHVASKPEGGSYTASWGLQGLKELHGIPGATRPEGSYTASWGLQGLKEATRHHGGCKA
ncbi:hypothetical protein RRG08_055836 [Elysia crispata]|uniref:Uncharacterized protein n=1 Tax=Elysia crispata TaxID=231223 RepID=A0AAE1AX24_9GAST|nr:hypothetical protein RRG08_055836 [Elysia crispata]